MNQMTRQIHVDACGSGTGTSFAADKFLFAQKIQYIAHRYPVLQSLAKRKAAAGGIANHGVHIMRIKRIAIVIPQLINAIQSEMLLHRTTTALIARHQDLHVVFEEDSHCREVDLTKDGFHQATGKQRDSRTCGAMLPHEMLCITGR